jgi:hypothetical protein
VKSVLVILFIFSHLISVGQENTHSQHIPPHKITFVLGYSFIDNSFSTSTDDILIVPTFGLNYDYFFTSKWGAGLHTDIILQQFAVEKHDGTEILIRENPVAICGIIIFKPTHHWSIIGGYGVEYENHDSFQIIRIGLEYEVPIQNNWEINFTSEYDIKYSAYSSLVIGVGFAKLLGK